MQIFELKAEFRENRLHFGFPVVAAAPLKFLLQVCILVHDFFVRIFCHLYFQCFQLLLQSKQWRIDSFQFLLYCIFIMVKNLLGQITNSQTIGTGDISFVKMVLSAHTAQKGCFTAAIAADNGNLLIAADFKLYILKNSIGAKIFGAMTYLVKHQSSSFGRRISRICLA